MFFFFFFQAEDGIRDLTVTGVQTCALPISNAGGLVGNGCVGHGASPGTSLRPTGRSSIGHTGRPLTRSKTNAQPCFVSCTTASMRLPSTVIVTRLGAEAGS